MTHVPGSPSSTSPAGVPVNNAPQYNLFNAPCALIKAEGDFVATVGVENTFDPGGEGSSSRRQEARVSFQSPAS